MVRDESGFTIIELMVAAAIALLIMGVLFNMIFNLSNTQRLSAKVNLQQQAKGIVFLMSREIREARDVRISEVFIDKISFETNSMDNASTVSYQLNGRKLVRNETRGGAPLANSNLVLLEEVRIPAVSSPMFEISASSSVVITLVVTGPGFAGDQTSARFSVRATNRNGGVLP